VPSTDKIATGITHLGNEITYRKFCPKCKKNDKVGTINLRIIPYRDILEHENVSYNIEVPQVTVLNCDQCSDYVVLVDDSWDTLIKELKRRAGLFSSAEIKENRERLGWTKKELAELLGTCQEATVERWENGGQIQRRQEDNKMRELFNYS